MLEGIGWSSSRAWRDSRSAPAAAVSGAGSGSVKRSGGSSSMRWERRMGNGGGAGDRLLERLGSPGVGVSRSLDGDLEE